MTDPSPIPCGGCNTWLKPKANFCTQCGKRVVKSDYSSTQLRSIRLGSTFLVMLVLLSGTYFIQAEGWDYQNRMYFEIGVFSSSMIFFLLNIDEGKVLISFRGIKLPIMLKTVSIGISSALLVYFSLSFVNNTILGGIDNFYYYWYIDFPYPKLAVFLFMAVGPALFEELAFRSFLFNQLQRFFTPQITIIISAFFFALVHFSLLSLIWIFPFGLFLGYLRWKYNTLWYGVALHFTHNFMVIMLEQFELGLLF